MNKFDSTKLPCYVCEEKQIKLVSRATWICQNCQKDNSMFVMYAYDAIEGGPPTKSHAKTKVSRKQAPTHPNANINGDK